MVMKDKLTKNNHSGIYYKVRNFLLAFAAVGCLAIAIAIPTYISVQNHQEAQTKADADSKPNGSEESLEDLESFQEEE